MAKHDGAFVRRRQTRLRELAALERHSKSEILEILIREVDEKLQIRTLEGDMVEVNAVEISKGGIVYLPDNAVRKAKAELKHLLCSHLLCVKVFNTQAKTLRYRPNLNYSQSLDLGVAPVVTKNDDNDESGYILVALKDIGYEQAIARLIIEAYDDKVLTIVPALKGIIVYPANSKAKGDLMKAFKKIIIFERTRYGGNR